jgi:hypothetical protein
MDWTAHVGLLRNSSPCFGARGMLRSPGLHNTMTDIDFDKGGFIKKLLIACITLILAASCLSGTILAKGDTTKNKTTQTTTTAAQAALVACNS